MLLYRICFTLKNEEIFFEVLTHPRPLTTIILYHRIKNLSIENGKSKCTNFRWILVRKLCNLHSNTQIDPAAAAVGPVKKKREGIKPSPTSLTQGESR